MSTPLDGLAATITAAMPPARHRLDKIGARWVWLYPIDAIDTAAEVAALCADLVAHGATGIVPQQSARAIAWARRWSDVVRSHHLDVVIGLGYLSADVVSEAIAACKAGVAVGVQIDQEAWHSVADSTALVQEVLRRHADAADWCADCHYPCLTTDGPHGRPTGWGKIALAWAPICGLRAPQCYWEGSPATDGWVLRRLAWARQDYPRAGGSPSSRVRASVQLYRRSVVDHVGLLLAEGETGSVWLWDWREADASARVALRVVHELEVRGHRGARAVLDYQRVTPTLTPDGAVGPKACAALGVDVPQGVVWRQS